jgi:high-affinity Fe2+/Pb2+ permease
MNIFDPTLLQMVLILPSLIGLSLLYEGMYKWRNHIQGWWLFVLSGLLALVAVGFLYPIFRNL